MLKMETKKFCIHFLDFGLDGCKCFLHDFCSCAGDNHKQEIFQEGICNGVELTSNRWIWNGAEVTGNSSGQRKSAIVQLKIDMDPRYVRLPISSRDSLGHQCYLTACVLGQYPSLHGSGKTDNHLATNDSSWFTSRVGTSQSGRGRCPFRWQVLSMGQLLRGSCGTPHNEF